MSGLGRLDGRVGPDRGAAPDVDTVSGEVDVCPAQRPQLLLARPGLGGGQVERGILSTGSGTDQRGELLGVQRLELAAVADGGTVYEIGAGRVAG